MKKFVFVIVGICLLCMMLSACTSSTPQKTDTSGDTSSSNSQTTSGEKLKIGVSVMDLSNSYFVDFANGAKKYGEENGIEIVINDPQSDTQKQVTAIENFISSGCNAIVVSALDAESCKNVIQEAESKGIRVITETTIVDGATSCVSFEEYDFGYALGSAAGEWINEKYNGKVEYAILNQPTLVQVIQREKGIQEGVAKFAPNAKLVSTVAAWLPDSGMKAAESILQKNPDVKVILGINDSGALGAYEAVKAAGLKDEDFFIGGCDASTEALERIKKDTMYRATVGLELANEDVGRACVDYAVRAINGEKLDKVRYLKAVAITEDNISEYIKD